MKSPWYKAETPESGFTLIEMIVATALFAVVMLISTAALLSLVGANRKAQALQLVMNNLNIALDSMVRSIRMGSEYHCGGGTLSELNDCVGDEDGEGGSDTFAFKSFEGDTWVYWFAEEDGVGRIYRSKEGDFDGVPITAPSVDIESLQFYVVGTTQGEADDTYTQPKAVIVVKGVAGADNLKTKTEFTIQATAVQRILDL